MSTTQQDYISKSREAAKAVYNGINTLLSMQKQWNDLAYGDNSFNGEGSNIGVNSSAVGAAVFDSANALRSTLDSGHGTNLAKLL